MCASLTQSTDIVWHLCSRESRLKFMPFAFELVSEKCVHGFIISSGRRNNIWMLRVDPYCALQGKTLGIALTQLLICVFCVQTLFHILSMDCSFFFYSFITLKSIRFRDLEPMLKLLEILSEK